MAKRVIFSDLHFGDPLCSLRHEAVTRGLAEYLRGLGGVEEVILAGDILDANVSSLSLAIWGRPASGAGGWPEQLGCEGWLSTIFQGLALNPKRIVYIPGNHDYIVWNLLATELAFMTPLSEGRRPKGLPMMSGFFERPFIRGIAPVALRDRFVVSYPNHEFNLGDKKVLVTHGHYLDAKQSLFRDLGDTLDKKDGNVKAAVRDYFKRTAQYQALANSVSYFHDDRVFVDKVHKGLSGLLDSIRFLGLLRKEAIDEGMLRAIEMYLDYFCERRPDYFIFGHTHEAGQACTSQIPADKRLITKDIKVINDGSFIESEHDAGSFVVVDDGPGVADPIRLLRMTLRGVVEPLR